jgi:Tol biopolymer transport system component/DNA-binding winged helix-turn-helix (wHTH) protein
MEAVKQERATLFYQFGPFFLDPAKCVLVRNGQIVPISLKAFEMLLVLVQHRGDLLQKDDLLRHLWPDTVVEENNLARNISALRKALDEHPNEHRYILTVPGRGYRFVAEVQEVESPEGAFNDKPLDRTNGVSATAAARLRFTEGVSDLPSPDGRALPEVNKHPRSIVSAAAMLIVAIAIGGLVIFALLQKSVTNRPPPSRRVWQLTFDPGLEGEPSWSPDGHLIAYSSDRSGNFDIWVQPVGEGNAVRVTNSPAHDWQPDWAPDGSRLVFRSERDGGGLFIVPVLGGSERKVSSFGYRPRWSSDGRQILFYSSFLRYNATEIPRVYVVGLDGRPPREALAGFLTEFISLQVAWHPDGQRISLWGNHREQGWSFWTVSLEGGAPVKSELAPAVKQQLKESTVSLSDFLWSPSGRTLFFEGVSQGVRDFWKVDVDPKTLRWTAGPERLTTGTSLATDMSISQDGKKLAFTVRSERTRLWSLPFDPTTGRTKGVGQPITSAGIDAAFPDIGPDGRLVFLAQRAGRDELWQKSLNDGRESLLVPPDDNVRFVPRWSRDGKQLAYSHRRPANPEHPEIERSIVLLPASGGDEQTLTTPGAELVLPWDWSADGKWILGGSEAPTPGRHLICLFPVAGAPHAETQMRVVTSHPEANLWQARFSPDNRWISFCAAKATEAGISTIFVVPTSGGEWTRITEGRYFDDKARWSPDGKILYFVSNRTGFFQVWGIRFDPSKGQPVGDPFRVTAFEGPGQMILLDRKTMEMALSADRLILPIMEVSGGIWILENAEQ